MDLWSVHLKNSSGAATTAAAAATTTTATIRSSLLRPRNSISSWDTKRVIYPSGSLGIKDLRVFEIRVFEKKSYYHPSQPFLVKAMAKKNPHNSNSSSSSSPSGNGDQSIPEGDGLKGGNPSSERNESNDAASQNARSKPLDWREFRALLYINEPADFAVSETHKQEKVSFGSRSLPLKWAHPISAPENGCVLVATEKLDGVRTFERTVVLLLRSGTGHPQEGPFGVVINRPLHKKIKHMKPSNVHLATTFADCSLHFGGPLEASMFLLRAEERSDLPGFEEVIPGVGFGSRNNLDEAGGLIKKGLLKPHDFRFFFGYAGWQLDQLREEIESDYWYVAACSANLIFGGSQNSSSEGLWEEILQLMGGHYSELSRKPKQDI